VSRRGLARGLGAVATRVRAGVQTADLSRIRHVDLSRFTIDRLVTILNRLNRHVEVCLTVRAAPAEHPAPVFS
jgi:predicted XRE-type DNA-binding protein